MPRRDEPDPLARAIGRRIRDLRAEAGLTMEKLAYESGTSKGHLSSMERGLVVPTVKTLLTLAERLGVLLADIVNDPRTGDRQRLIEESRHLPPGPLRRLVRELGAAGARKRPLPR